MKDTHPQVKFDVFERLNTGAVKLSAQELRHGIYHGRLIDWIDRKARDGKWRALLGARSDKRMKAQEFILRFLALHQDLETYEKPLAAFLNTFAEANRDATPEQLEEFARVLSRAVTGVDAVFGPHAFKVLDPDDNHILSPFNAALFDAQMIAVSRSSIDVSALGARDRKLMRERALQLFRDDAFQKAITRATSDVHQIQLRISLVEEALFKN